MDSSLQYSLLLLLLITQRDTLLTVGKKGDEKEKRRWGNKEAQMSLNRCGTQLMMAAESST